MQCFPLTLIQALHISLIRCFTKSMGLFFVFVQLQFIKISKHDYFFTTQTLHIRKDSSPRVIIPKQRPLPDKTQHSKETDIHAPGGIRTRNPSKRAVADPSFRPRGHWDRHTHRVDE